MSAVPNKRRPQLEHVYRVVSPLRVFCLVCEVHVTRGLEKHHEARKRERHPISKAPTKPLIRAPQRRYDLPA